MSARIADNAKNILLILERDNFIKDYQLIKTLEESLRETGYVTVRYRSGIASTSTLLDPGNRLGSLPSFIRKPLKALLLLRYPDRWGYFFSWYSKTEESIEHRCKKLKRFIKELGEGKNIIILSRSAGGRISSLVADELGIKKLICLGYPFKHPQKPPEEERFKHLANLKTPFLILQGERDEYGGIKEIPGTYPLAPNTSIAFFNTDHEFALTKSQYESVSDRIKEFIAKP
jgi:hypothetical protein